MLLMHNRLKKKKLSKKKKKQQLQNRLKMYSVMSVTRMFLSTIAMMIHRCFRMYPLRYRQENQLRLLDRQEAERLQYAHCFRGFMT